MPKVEAGESAVVLWLLNTSPLSTYLSCRGASSSTAAVASALLLVLLVAFSSLARLLLKPRARPVPLLELLLPLGVLLTVLPSSKVRVTEAV